MGYDIFISYSSKDKIYADAVCASLEKAKWRCWIAPRDILPGENWGEAIIDAITDCKMMVIIFSANANASQQVMREVERAVFKNLPIVPFRIQDIKPTKSMEFFLSTPHWLDAIDDDQEKHINELLETVERILNSNFQGQESMATYLPKEPSKIPVKNVNQHASENIPKKKKWFLRITGIFILLFIIIAASVITTLILEKKQYTNLETVTNEFVRAPKETIDTFNPTDKVVEDNSVTQSSVDVAALITSGNINDSLVKYDIWSGVLNASEYYNLETYLYETDYYTENESIDNAIFYGSDIIILQGQELSSYIEIYAPINPDIQFVLINGVSDYYGENFIQINFIDYEAVFVAGYIASLETETNRVAFVGINGVTDSNLTTFFEKGANYYRDIEVYNLDVNSALDYIVEYDIDVIYNMAGENGSYLINAAEENGYYVIGDQSIYGSYSPNFLTSLIRNYNYAASGAVNYYMLYGVTGGRVIYSFENSMIFFPNYGLSESSENAKFDMIFDILDGYIKVEY